MADEERMPLYKFGLCAASLRRRFANRAEDPLPTPPAAASTAVTQITAQKH